MRLVSRLLLVFIAALSMALAACGSLGGGNSGAVDARIVRSGDPAQYGAIVRMETAPGFELALDRAALEGTVLTMELTLRSPPAGTPSAGSTVRHQVNHSTGTDAVAEVRVLLRTVAAEPGATPTEYMIAGIAH